MIILYIIISVMIGVMGIGTVCIYFMLQTITTLEDQISELGIRHRRIISYSEYLVENLDKVIDKVEKRGIDPHNLITRFCENLKTYD